MPAEATPLPFTVIGGFLGAGKTTLLLRWLQAAQGRRLAVLVNDFGALNIDAALVAQRDADTIALSNGCVCCSIGDDLSQALQRVLAAQPPFDAVVVEASGVADPWRIAQYAVADPQLTLDGVIVLVDASMVLAQAADPLLADTIERPLRRADLVLLNKADLVDADTLAAARCWLEAAAGGAPVITAVQAELPLALLCGAHLHRPRGGWAPTGDAGHDARFQAWSLRPTGRYEVPRLRDWLRAVPAGVLRLKGLLQVADGSWTELQFAGRRGALRPLDRAPAEGAALVAIGWRGALPEAALAAGLQQCAADGGGEAAPRVHQTIGGELGT